MSQNKSSTRAFYEDLYERGSFNNPAEEIYNALRIQIISEMLKNYKGNMLIVGCGRGKDLSIASSFQRIYAFDLSFNAVRQISDKGGALFVGDALDLPFPANYFSIIVCSEVLEHIPDFKQAIREFHRVLKKEGVLIVSSPNWLSWFGLARRVGETLLNRPFHSSDQPYDDWKTLWKYKRELWPEFSVAQVRGVWYLPPLHYKNKGLPALWTKKIYASFRPLERFFSRALPWLGHLIVLKCFPQK
jgi:ubiquinone/menaquinone biosynthesis C-methylase UbiE